MESTYSKFVVVGLADRFLGIVMLTLRTISNTFSQLQVCHFRDMFGVHEKMLFMFFVLH